MKSRPLFIVIAILAILWNFMGIFQFIATAYPPPEMMDALTEEQANLVASYPWWLFLFFGAGVFNGTLASLLLLMRKKLATPLFLVSWLGVTLQMAYWLFGMGAASVMGPEAYGMPVIVVAIAGFLYFFSKKQLA